MTRLADNLRNSRGYSEFARYTASRARQRTTTQGWWLWPFCLAMFACGVPLLAVALYQGQLLAACFVLLWLGLVAYMSWPLRRSWHLHRSRDAAARPASRSR